MSPNEAGPKTKDAAKQALAIDEPDAGAHGSMAIATHWCDWNWAGAEKEFKRGPPHSLQGRENLAMVLEKWGEIAAIPYCCHQT